MKKVFVSILSILYLIVACGFAVNIHYCMGRVSNIEYSYSNNKNCDRCGMENKNGCCHSEFKVIKISDDQQTAKANIDIAQQPVIINYFAIAIFRSVQGSEKITASKYHSPPDKRLSAVYLHDRVFRI
jgi:hypothetical protein